MKDMKTINVHTEWGILKRHFPENWEEMAFTLRAITRKRKLRSPEVLLRLILIHVAEGLSLRETVAYAKQAGLCDINDVALLCRLKSSADWLRWMCVQLVRQMTDHEDEQLLARKFTVRLVDGTHVSEPGSTGTNWRIHYSLRLSNLFCDGFELTGPKVGESLCNFSVAPDDLMIGDRAYCTRKGLVHVLDRGGQSLVRWHSTSLPLLTRRGAAFPLLKRIQALRDGERGDWDCWFRHTADRSLVKGRILTIRKSEQAAAAEKKKILQYAKKKKQEVRPETLVFAEYVLLFTTLNRHRFNDRELLLLYRLRWQIEVMFKRLKSIAGLGHLPKMDPQSCKAWLYAKLMLAMLVELLKREADLFSPWGYKI